MGVCAMASAVDRWLAGTLRAVLKRVDSLESRAAGLEKTCGALLAAPAPGIWEAVAAPAPGSAFVPSQVETPDFAEVVDDKTFQNAVETPGFVETAAPSYKHVIFGIKGKRKKPITNKETKEK